jgi:hypothetical protein
MEVFPKDILLQTHPQTEGKLEEHKKGGPFSFEFWNKLKCLYPWKSRRTENQ